MDCTYTTERIDKLQEIFSRECKTDRCLLEASLLLTEILELQSTITSQAETITRYQSLMTKHIVGKCTRCNYTASWPVCTKCGTPYPESESTLNGVKND